MLIYYLWIDLSISITYSDTSYETSRGLKRVLPLLENEWFGISEQELLEKLKAEADRQPDEKILIFKDDESNIIGFDILDFEFESGKLKRITLPTWNAEVPVKFQPQN